MEKSESNSYTIENILGSKTNCDFIRKIFEQKKIYIKPNFNKKWNCVSFFNKPKKKLLRKLIVIKKKELQTKIKNIITLKKKQQKNHRNNLLQKQFRKTTTYLQ